MLALLLAAVPLPASAGPVLDCRLTTPAGDEIGFTARLAMPLAVLEPVSGAVWPTQRVIGPGGWREKKGFEASYHFAGDPSGIDLKVTGERAALFVGKRLQSGQPRASGFCLPRADASPARPDALVSPDAGANVPAFDTARWPASCGFITRSGRRANIGYEILDGGARSAIRSSEPGLLASSSVSVPRAQGSGRTPTHFGGRDGPSGTEMLVVDAKAGEAIQLIDFDRIGTVAAEPAAAICGHTGVVRRPVMQ